MIWWAIGAFYAVCLIWLWWEIRNAPEMEDDE